jgi:hypothetical protein
MSNDKLREDAARLVDPLPWQHLDDIRSRKECGYGVQDMTPEQQFQHVDALGDLTKSLAKADAILALALSTPPTEARAMPPVEAQGEVERGAFQAAMVDAARARGGAGAQFIADGHTNLWIDIAQDAFAALAGAKP